jgi:hypothetical protein
MEDKYRIRKIKSPDGKVILFPLKDSQVSILKALDKWVDAMRQIEEELNPTLPPANADCCQRENQTEPSAEVSKEEDRQ